MKLLRADILRLVKTGRRDGLAQAPPRHSSDEGTTPAHPTVPPPSALPEPQKDSTQLKPKMSLQIPSSPQPGDFAESPESQTDKSSLTPPQHTPESSQGQQLLSSLPVFPSNTTLHSDINSRLHLPWNFGPPVRSHSQDPPRAPPSDGFRAPLFAQLRSPPGLQHKNRQYLGAYRQLMPAHSRRVLFSPLQQRPLGYQTCHVSRHEDKCRHHMLPQYKQTRHLQSALRLEPDLSRIVNALRQPPWQTGCSLRPPAISFSMGKRGLDPRLAQVGSC